MDQETARQSFISLGCAGIQYSGVFMVVSTVDPGLQELQRFGSPRLCSNEENQGSGIGPYKTIRAQDPIFICSINKITHFLTSNPGCARACSRVNIDDSSKPRRRVTRMHN
uniref:SFRICE_007408 n=1 Tax=Spodoptera frugiperda TaxID=7108 RepID=A0A2H1WN11_SPOFR